MFDEEWEIFKTEDLYDTLQYQDNDGSGISLTGAIFSCFVKKDAQDTAELITNANITITLLNQTTNPGEFTVFIDRSQYQSLLGAYVFRISITLISIDYTIVNYKLCIND